MSSSGSDAVLPGDFQGAVRLFPLPNLVLFPHGTQPLHIFEPRFRSMLEDAIAEDQLLAMALLQPGWEADYDGEPAIFPVICVGRILSHTRLEDGRYNILLKGLRRASVIRELPDNNSYRTAEVVVLEDVYAASAAEKRAHVRSELLEGFQKLVPHSIGSQQLLQAFEDPDLSLGVLTDLVAFTIPFALPFKQKLLAEWNVDVRARLLVDRLSSLGNGQDSSQRPFPPSFSDN